MKHMKQVLFVAYGSGHIKMLIPVAQALQSSGLAHPVVLALTTAAPVAQAAGLDVRRFKDFVQPGDEKALQTGRRLVADLITPALDPDESTAYLGLSYADLVEDKGAEEAEKAYHRLGRQAFLPVRMLTRILDAIRPDLVVSTNAPRAERAAIIAARARGIPALCVVDLFALNEVQWLCSPNYADRVCVLNSAVRDFLVGAGRPGHQVVVTGNPGFDRLNSGVAIAAGRALRTSRGWDDRAVVLWPTQVEPAVHPASGLPGNAGLPDRVLQQLVRWVTQNQSSVLCVRTREAEPMPALPKHPRVVLTGQEIELSTLLHATDVVVTLTSTVGLEGHLAGCHLIQVTGSVCEDAMPLRRYGIADEAVAETGVGAALDHWTGVPRRSAQALTPATARVMAEIHTLLEDEINSKTPEMDR
jgi:hypothetical protein